MLQSMKDYSHDIRPKETVHLELQHRLQTLQLRQPRHVRQKRMYLIRVLRTCNIWQRIKNEHALCSHNMSARIQSTQEYNL